MNNFIFITPEDFIKKHPETQHTLEELKELASAPDQECHCGELAWKYAGLGMCFSCTIGESDASEDYELI